MSSDWSKMIVDLIDLIMKRLDLIEFIRAGAVCQSWYSAMKSCRYISPSKSPWLILSSPHQPEFRYVNNTACKFNLPNMKHHYTIGSSLGFIISIDEIGQLHATNPITGSHRLLPSIATLPCCEGTVRDPITNKISSYLFRHQTDLDDYDIHYLRKYFFRKVALFPTSSSAGVISVMIHDFLEQLAFARESDESWTFIDLPIAANFEDFTFYKGLLYAVNWKADLLAFDILNFSASSTPVIYLNGWTGNFHSDGHKYLVQSPCGSDLFLIVKGIENIPADDGDEYEYGGPLQTVGFKTYKLNQEDHGCPWSQVSNFATDPVAVFLGLNPSIMVMAKDIPGIPLNKGDCIYFTDDEFGNVVCRKQQKKLDIGIFYMGDNKIVPLDMTYHDLQQFNYPPPFWFTPFIK